MWSLAYYYDQATGHDKKPSSDLLMFEMSSLFSLLFTVSLWSFLSSCPLCLSHTQTKQFKADSCELPPSPTRGATSISEQLPRSQSCKQQTHIQLQWRLWLPAKRSWGPRTGNVQCSVCSLSGLLVPLYFESGLKDECSVFQFSGFSRSVTSLVNFF